MQLLIMAAGMGSRFGGLKQITPVGPNGEFIIDYSIYDAKQAGFNKIVIVTKKELLEDFKETIGKRIEKYIDVEYVFQDINDIPDFVTIPEGRTKPWGTGHALYSARNAITEPFAIITADDFYGREAYLDAVNALKNENEYSIVSYQVANTISENGTTKRGVCYEKNGEFEKIVESEIEVKDGKIFATPLNGGDTVEIAKDQPVSMSLFALQPNIFDFIKTDIVEFFKNAKDLEKVEYFTPDIIDKMHKRGQVIRMIKTKSTWKGITYKEDLEDLKQYINQKIEEGVYPEKLWR